MRRGGWLDVWLVARMTVLVFAIGVWCVGCAPDPSPIVHVTGGAVQGFIEEGVAVYKGVPFAAPPVGRLRWRAPEVVRPWSGVRQAGSFRPGCWQSRRVSWLMAGRGGLDEDCLYLNVWHPVGPAPSRRPVMVFVHGGAFSMGGASSAWYDGAALAREGVVVVTVAYRLGPFGFLAHPALSAESGRGSGSYGLMDQIAALRWVRDNILAFGGDPDNVTVFGESAGAQSVSLLTQSPLAAGLFQRAISQSGGMMAPFRRGADLGAFVPTLSMAEAEGQAFFRRLQVKDLAAARAVEAWRIVDATEYGPRGTGFWPVADGVAIVGDPVQLFVERRINATPILIGTNSNEGTLFVRSGDHETLARLLADAGPVAERLKAAYPGAVVGRDDEEALQASRDLVRDVVFGWPTWTWARLHSEYSGQPVYVYYFEHKTADAPRGATHGQELGLVFGRVPGLLFARTLPEGDQDLARQVRGYWTNFARTGNPNGPGLPVWPAFTPADHLVMRLAPTGLIPYPNEPQLQAVDQYFAHLRHQSTGR